MKTKMKQIVFFLLLLSVGVTFPSCEDNNGSGKEVLPETARTFLNDYLPNHKILSIDKNKMMAIEPLMYDVALEGGVSVLFGADGSVYYITAKSEIPQSVHRLIGENTLIGLESKEPGAKIVKITSSSYYSNQYQWIIELDSKKEYADCYGFESRGLGTLLHKEEIPQLIKEFLIRHNFYDPVKYDKIVRMTESRGDVYYMSFGKYLNFSFDKNGKWIQLKEDNYNVNAMPTDFITKIVVKELPASVITAINSSVEPLGALRMVTCYKEGIYGLQFDHKALLVDSQSGIIDPPAAAADKLINLYFDVKLIFPPKLEIHNPYEFSFLHTYNTNTTNRSHPYLRMGINGWEQIYCLQISSPMDDFMPIPQKFIEQELPKNIVDYLKTNYIRPLVTAVIHKDGQYIVGVFDNDDILYFDESGNFIKKESVSYRSIF